MRRVPAPRMNLSPTLGRARLPPSRKPREGEAPAEPSTPWEGEAPAEPRVETNGCYCGVWVDLFHHGIHGIHGNTTERLSRCLRVPTVVVHERSRPWWGEAPAEPRDSAARQCSAQQKLRTPKRQAFGSAGASPSQRQAFGSAGASHSQKTGVRLSRSFPLPKGRRSAQRELRTPKGSVRLSRSFALPKTGVRLSRSFALPKDRRSAQQELRAPKRQAFGSAEASHYQRGNNVARQSAGAYLTSR